MAINIINYTKHKTKTLQYCLRYARPKNVKHADIVVSNFFFDKKHHMFTGEIKDVDYSSGWECDAFTGQWRVYITITDDIKFPTCYYVNPDLKQRYMRGMTFFNKKEFFVYLMAHELRHLEQELIKPKNYIGAGLPGNDYESDADFYAIHCLNRYRRLTKFKGCPSK